MNNITDIINNLDNLDSDARRAVYDRLSYQMSKRSEFTPAERDVWDAAVTVSGERRSLTSLFNDRKYTRAKYSRKVECLCDWLAAGCRNELTRQQNVALLGVSMECLKKWLKVNKRPVILATLVDHLEDMPAALDLSFPGYASAKMLDLLVRFQKDPENPWANPSLRDVA